MKLNKNRFSILYFFHEIILDLLFRSALFEFAELGDEGVDVVFFEGVMFYVACDVFAPILIFLHLLLGEVTVAFDGSVPIFNFHFLETLSI